MILNNTQANIFKVNGGIADNFANRPAASGSFYIFYSIDTQEIFYDNGAWVLIGSGGGGGGVNIYNSDGTLTGNRDVQGSNNTLRFLGNFGFFAEGSFFATISNTNNQGFSVDQNGTILIGNYNATQNVTYIYVSDANQIIKTTNQNNDIGLKLDFANQTHFIGDPLNGVLNINSGGGILEFIWLTNNKLLNVDASGIVGFGDLNNMVGGTKLITDFANSVIKTETQGGDIGLKLDFANSLYQFGQITGNNTTFLQIDDSNEILKTQSSAIIDGLNFDFANEIFEFGQINSSNGVHIKINGSAGIDTLQTIYNNNEQGLELQLNNRIYRLGHLVGGNQTQINLNDTLQAIILESSINIPGEEIKLIINGGSSALVLTQFQQTDIGLKLDFPNQVYQLGQITGANTTHLTIDDGAAYPVQLDGTNITSGTSGGVSGQHLKIKINGVDYKIELRNP